ncbi:efflux RND transporter permease subunit [Gracilinema caldarium]|uniref:Acriflavin resistance protein n=1 Tax=Gracilinema caldarium (strain ATCC 51460 / DSM 7334 / H1) TaxID=744872 RepID=F8EXI7_GRAC1|nr:efflux RND transporter permease subunit [Gracilinema caldarium]AEJ19214.1 acriflavin resistance protein [Gracilinema caldarium DSM 7334]
MGIANPKRTLAILLVCISLSAALMIRQGPGTTAQDRDPSYVVTLRHYGVEAREMERTVAIPLEDALSAIPGISNLVTTSEQGKVRVLVHFTGTGTGTYEAVRDAAQRVYETLPPSAQRPEITSSRDSRIPVWSAAVFLKDEDPASAHTLGSLLERVVKPALERIDGAGEIELAGTGLPEVVISLDEKACAARGIAAWNIARQLAEQDLLFPAGHIDEGDRRLFMTLDGRFETAKALEHAPIALPSGQMVPLLSLGKIVEQDRQPETIARLDGKPAAVISVMGSSQVKLNRLSKQIRQILKDLEHLPLVLYVLSDRGKEEEEAFLSVVSATVQGSIILAVTVALLSGGFSVISILSVPLIIFFAGAILVLFGFSLDRLSLAGLACGVGAAVDCTIVVIERLQSCQSRLEKEKSLMVLAPSLFASTATTVVALIPLALLGSNSAIVGAIAWGIGTTSVVALGIGLGFLPAFITSPVPRCMTPWPRALGIRHYATLFTQRVRKSFSWLMIHSYQKPRRILLLSSILSIAGLGALYISGADVANLPSEDSVYAQVEFEGGLVSERVDELISEYAVSLRSKKGIRAVQTSARTASASVMISFNPRETNLDAVRVLARSTPVYGGFVYIPEASSQDRIWTITIAGDDDEVCRRIARDLARSAQASPLVSETVLNFKDGSQRLFLHNDGERMAALGLSASFVADTLRRALFGPVIYKRLNETGETDVRLRFATETYVHRDTLYHLPLSPAIETHTVVHIKEDREPASIRRENRRRTASISIRTRPMDPRKVRDQLQPLLEKILLPPGYVITFDREAIAAADNLSRMGLHFTLALIFCFMVIAAATESVQAALVILAAVPPALAVPALTTLLSGSSIDVALACAFVAVSGITVNAAVLSVEALREQGPISSTYTLYRALRKRLPPLFSTSLTTVVGSLPFLCIPGAANQMIRSLALVNTLGVSMSFLVSLSLIPALARLWPAVTFPQEAGIQPYPSSQGALV